MSERAPAGFLDGVFDRTLANLRSAWREIALSARGVLSGAPRPDLPEDDVVRLKQQMLSCLDGRGGEVTARARAAELGRTYLALNPGGRERFLRLLAEDFDTDHAAVGRCGAALAAAATPAERDIAERNLRAALLPPRVILLRQFNALPEGVKFLVDRRAELVGFGNGDPAIRGLGEDLRELLANWFDIGFLELKRITWEAPAALLEKLIEYEAVHEIRSWSDLKNRLDSDRRCYAFFHPRMPMEPLIFVEVALTDHLADNVQAVLDEHAPVFDARRATTAIFYSISNTQAGLRGVSFGNFLLKRVVDDLKRDYPRLTTFATLSPLPSLRRWSEKHPAAWLQAFSADDLERIARCCAAKGSTIADGDDVRQLLADDNWAGNTRLARLLQPGLVRLAARYLLTAKTGDRPYDPVARFHLGNGARIERLNYLADTSARGLQQSYGLMVNYLYDPDAIEANVEAFSRDGEIAAAAAIRRGARD